MNNRRVAAAACVVLLAAVTSCGRVGIGSAGGDTSGWGWDVAIDDAFPVDPFIGNDGQPSVEGAVVTEAEPLEDFRSVSADDVVGETVAIGQVGGWEVGHWTQQPPGEPVWDCTGVNDPNAAAVMHRAGRAASRAS